jgi:hypothetical protein
MIWSRGENSYHLGVSFTHAGVQDIIFGLQSKITASAPAEKIE